MLKLPVGEHVRANGIRQHFLRFGEQGPHVVIVPGIVSPAMLWAHVGEWLGQACRCLVLDVRGRGLSEAGAHLDYGLDACAADLAAFLDRVPAEPALVIGHSMGARIALRAAVGAPERMRSLVLVDPPTSGPGRRAYPIPAERTLALVRAAQRGEALEAMRASPAAPWPEPLQALRAEWLATCDERVAAAAYADFHGQDAFADLAATRLPVSLVCAGEGGVVSDDDVAEMNRLRPDLQAMRIEGVGHQMQAENFGVFRRALRDVLSRQDPAFGSLEP